MCEYLDSAQTAFPRICGTLAALRWGQRPHNHTPPKGSFSSYYACNLKGMADYIWIRIVASLQKYLTTATC